MSEGTAGKEEPVARLEKPDFQALLEAANSASERVAGLHVAFMAICAYVLVIAFGTTDLDLLVGKGVRLPVVNVDVPIAGFYAFMPYLVVLVHFNLLLQLQLLSRKLFAFDEAAPKEGGIGGIRDRLSIFPYTYYLIGKPSPLVQSLLGLIVSITLVLLPFITMFALQLQFLAYQSEAVTWLQRTATWLDIAVVVILWPVILDPRDDWLGYWHNLIAAYIPRRSVWLAFVLLFAGIILLFFGLGIGTFAGIILLLMSALSLIPLRGWNTTSCTLKLYIGFLVSVTIVTLVLAVIFLGSLGGGLSLFLRSMRFFLLCPLLLIPLAVLWHPKAPRGSLVLLLILLIGMPLPLALFIDGERIERQGSPQLYTWFSVLIEKKRSLDLHEQILLAKPTNSETLILLRSEEGHKVLKQIEPINLVNRNFRHANMEKVILVGADLRNSQLQHANLFHAQLQGADLESAGLQGANLQSAGLQGTNLKEAKLQGANLLFSRLVGANLHRAQLQVADLGAASLQSANLWGAQLQGAVLDMTNLQGANLLEARLEGANLQSARLQGANLQSARLQGAILENAQLQGTNLQSAQLQCVNLRKAELYAAITDKWTRIELSDARNIVWKPLGNDILEPLITQLQTQNINTNRLQPILDRLKESSRPDARKLRIQSCLAEDDTPLICENRYDPQKPQEVTNFIQQLNFNLAHLACNSSDVAWGIIRHIPKEKRKNDSSSRGLEIVLKKHLNDKKCKGLQDLKPYQRSMLQALK